MRLLSSTVITAAVLSVSLSAALAPGAAASTRATNANASGPAAEDKARALLAAQSSNGPQQQFWPASGTLRNVNDNDRDDHGSCGDRHRHSRSWCPPKRCHHGHDGEDNDDKKNCRKHKSGDDD